MGPLRTALLAERDARKEKPDANTDARSYRPNYADAFGPLGYAGEALARGDDTQALSYLAQIRSITSSDEAIKAYNALVEQIHRQQTDREAAFETGADAAIKHASEAVGKAREPKDLDAVLEEINDLLDKRVGNSLEGRQTRLGGRLQATASFVRLWQNYLFALGRNDETTVASTLHHLADNGNSQNTAALIPRSEILARLPADRSVDGLQINPSAAAEHQLEEKLAAAASDILDRTRNLDDVPAALGKLAELRKGLSNSASANAANSEYGEVVTNLQGIQNTRVELQTGLATTVSFTHTHTGPGSPRDKLEARFLPLRAQLIAEALPRLLGAPDEKAAQGEGVDSFLQRLIEEARKRADWTAVVRGLDIGRVLASANGGSYSNGIQGYDGYKQFLSGLNLEEAGQYEQAVIAYLNALKTGVPDLPAALIGEHLAAIRKAHAAEFAEGNNFVLNPPPQTFPYGPYGGRGMYDPRFGHPGMPGGLVPEPTDTPAAIAVPAAPKPAASASPMATPTAHP